MSNAKTCSIQLLSKTYEVRCPEEEIQTLQQAAQMLNKKLLSTKKQFKKLGELECLVLAALTMGHELLVCQKEQGRQREQIRQFVSALNPKESLSSHSEEFVVPETD
ncbi:MAG: cell division protein ZapA [Legionellaceae bacterium]|nr:cell division protein ZapA [Legionellaceae bacterium]